MRTLASTGHRPSISNIWPAAAALLLAAVGGATLPRLPIELAILVAVGATGAISIVFLLFITSAFDVAAFVLMGFGALLPLTAVKVTNGVFWYDVLLLLCVPFAVLAALRDDSLEILRPYRPILFGGFAIIVGGLLGSFRSTNVAVSLVALGKLAIVTLVMPVVIGLVADTIRKYQLLALSFAISAILSVAVALTQTPSNVYTERRTGLAFHVNSFGMMSTVGFAFTFSLVFQGSRVRRAAAVLGSLILADGTLLSGSRSALLGLWIVLLVSVILQRRRWLALVAILMPVAFLLLALLHDFGDSENALARISQQLRGAKGSGATESDAARRELLTATIDRIKESPLLGSGLVDAQAGHSMPIQMLMATGLVGFLGLVFVVWQCGLLPFCSLTNARSHNQPINWVLIGSLSGYFGVLAIYLTSNPLWDRTGWLLPVMTVGCWTLLKGGAIMGGNAEVDTRSHVAARPPIL